MREKHASPKNEVVIEEQTPEPRSAYVLPYLTFLHSQLIGEEAKQGPLNLSTHQMEQLQARREKLKTMLHNFINRPGFYEIIADTSSEHVGQVEIVEKSGITRRNSGSREPYNILRIYWGDDSYRAIKPKNDKGFIHTIRYQFIKVTPDGKVQEYLPHPVGAVGITRRDVSTITATAGYMWALLPASQDMLLGRNPNEIAVESNCGWDEYRDMVANLNDLYAQTHGGAPVPRSLRIPLY